MAVPIFNNSPSYLTGAGGVRQGSSIPLNLPSSLVRPTSAATRAVDQARIRKENEERLKGISDAYDYVTRRGNLMFDDAGVVMQDAYDNASVAIPQAFTDLGNFAGDVAYNVNRDMVPIFQLGRDIKSGVGSAVEAAAPYVDDAVFAAYPYVDTAVSKAKELADKVDITMPDMSLPDSAYDFGAAVRAAPADIARHLMYPFNKAAIAVENVGTDILDSDFVGGLTGREEGVTYTEARDKAKSKLSPSGTTDDTFKEKTPEEKSQDLQTAKIQTKLKDTSALDKSEGQGSGADNWFDAVNERVDLMAMGAAMLAGSSSGEGTLANLGKGLQAGIAAKKSAAQTAEAKKYRDAALALDAIRAQAASRRARAQEMAALAKDPLSYRESVDALSSELQVAGADAENTKVISQFMLGRPELSRALSLLSGNTRKQFIKDFVSAGQGWVGDKIEYGNVGSAFQTALDNLKESK